MMNATDLVFSELDVSIPFAGGRLHGQLSLPPDVRGVIMFAHGSGSSRHSPRNRYAARILQDDGFGTLLFDLLTHEEEAAELRTGCLRFDIPFLGDRLALATEWLLHESPAGLLELGYFGASTGAAAALIASTRFPNDVRAVVSRGGRPDLAGDALENVTAPTLLIVGAHDSAVLDLNIEAYARLKAPKDLETIPGASHLFEEPGTLEKAARLASLWFQAHIGRTED